MLSYDEYTARNEARLAAAYELGNFAEDMDYDVFCLECYNDYTVNTLLFT